MSKKKLKRRLRKAEDELKDLRVISAGAVLRAMERGVTKLEEETDLRTRLFDAEAVLVELVNAHSGGDKDRKSLAWSRAGAVLAQIPEKDLAKYEH